ncbi:MAG: bifunctional DNA primase/polymerase [Thermoproteota archaeon]|nr:bifunctional DNA primase/polymerase [Thermoproteota archaeon]
MNPKTGTPKQLESRKKPFGDWKLYQVMRPSKRLIEKWFSHNPNYNLMIVTGSVSKILALDVDGPTACKIVEEKRMQMSTNLRVAFDNTMVNKTGSGGLHVIFRIEDPIDDISQLTLWEDGNGQHSEIKLQGNRHYIVAAPSIHPNGNKYEWNGKHPNLITRKELDELIRLLSPQGRSLPNNNNKYSTTRKQIVSEGSRTLSAKDTERLLTTLKPRYINGRRHRITLGYSGFLRKCGYSLQAVEEFCVIVCQTFNDEEFESRLHDVRDTFRKPMNTGREIAGWSLLNDIS